MSKVDKSESFFEETEVEEIDTEQKQTAEPEAEQPMDSRDEAGETQEPVAEGEELGDLKPEDSPKAEIPDKENPESFKFWQSVAQKYESKFGVKPDEISDEEAALFRTFRSNPDALNETIKYLSNPKPQADSPKEEKPKAMERPVEPEVPANYSAYDIADPESASFKYEQDYKKYLRDSLEYERQQREVLQQTIQQKEMLESQREQEKSFKQQVKEKAIQMRGYSEEQAEKFVQFVDRAKNGTFEADEVFTMFEGFSGQKVDEERGQKQELDNKKDLREKYSAPSPAAAGGTGSPLPSPSKKKDGDSFFQYVER